MQGSRWREIETRICSRNDLHLDLDYSPHGKQSDDSKMYPIHPKSKASVDYYHKKFRCTDEEISVIGDYNSDIARQYVIQFERCDNATRSTCKTEDEITDYLKEKYILILQNSLRFETEKHSDL